MLTYAGSTYPSEKVLCKAYRYSFKDFCQYQAQGMSIPEIMLAMAHTNTRAIIYQGIVYINRKELCESLGLDYFRFRSKFESTGSVEEAVSYAKTQPATRKSIVVNGKTYKNYTDLCKKEDISYASFMSFIHVQGLSPDEAYQRCIDNKNNKPVFEYQGTTYPSLMSLCKAQNWSYTYFNAMLRKGRTFNEIVKLCESREDVRDTSPKPVVFRGETYRSLHALTKAFDLVYPDIFQSIANGGELEDVINDALARKKTSNRSSMYRGQPIVIFGESFESIKSALDNFGIKQAIYYMRKSARPDLSPEELIENLLSDEKYLTRRKILSDTITINGKTYGSRREAFEDLNMSQTAVYAIMRKQGLSFEDAVIEYLRRRESREKREVDQSYMREMMNQPVVIQGKTFSSMKDAMMHFGISPSMLNNHVLKTGESPFNSIVSLVSKTKQVEPFVIFDKSYRSKNAVYNEFKLNAYAVNKCMAEQNLSFSEAVEWLVRNKDKETTSFTRTKRAVTINGVTYSSISSALDNLLLSPSVFYTKKSTTNLPDEDIINEMLQSDHYTGKVKNRKTYKINGKTYKSKDSVLKDLNLSRYKVNSYMDMNNCSFEDAVNHLLSI